jgi:hypothetical protein
MDQENTAGQLAGPNSRTVPRKAIVLVQIKDARAECFLCLLGRVFLSHNVVEPGQRGALGADPDIVAKSGYVRPDHVEKRLIFVDDKRSDLVVWYRRAGKRT